MSSLWSVWNDAGEQPPDSSRALLFKLSDLLIKNDQDDAVELHINKIRRSTILTIIMALPAARAIRSYCTGLIHWPVSATIANAGKLIR